MRAGVVVANPSSTPESVHAASALARAGLLSRYYVPVAITTAQEATIQRLLPKAIARPVLRELRRRTLPEGVPPECVRRVAAVTDLQRVAASRLHLPTKVRTRLAYRHRAAFDREVAGRLRNGDRALFGMLGTATESVRAARRVGVKTLLDSQISHFGWLRDLMREEAMLVPEYAATLQFHDVRDSVIAAYQVELELADCIFVLSSHARRTFLERGADDSKLIDMPLGVDLELFSPRPREDDGVFRILFVGQVTQRKGLSYLVEAFKRARIPRSELLLAGEVIGTAKPWISVPNVRHLGPMPRRDLPRVYASADVYVLPSLAEGFPLTSIEAMASALPVILSDHTFAHDVIVDGVNGFVVPIRDPDAIAERLRVLAGDRDRRAALAMAARRTAEGYPWSDYGNRIVQAVASELGRGLSHTSAFGRP